MANYDPAYDKTAGHEGGYSNHVADGGGETYKGIARHYWGDWSGWTIIDNAKSKPDFPQCLDRNAALQQQVKAFYRTNFWNRFMGDRIPWQDVAEEIFDNAVNAGVSTSVKWLQRALNVLNRRGKAWPNIAVDGGLGPNTLAMMQKAVSADGGTKVLLNVMNGYQAKHYLDIMEKDESQEDFARGWFTRVEIRTR